MARLLIVDPGEYFSKALVSFLEGAGYSVTVATTSEETFATIRREEIALAVISVSDDFEGEIVSLQVKRLRPEVGLLLVYPIGVQDAYERAIAAKADGCLMTPVKRAVALSLVRNLVEQRAAQARATALQGELARAKVQLEILKTPNAIRADFFKQYMMLEIKRSRRYHHPVAVMIVGVDPTQSEAAEPPLPHRAAMMTLLSRGVRDVDIVVPLSDDRHLVFLPDTPRDGALLAAERLVKKLNAQPELQRATISIGVAAWVPKGSGASVTFGSLMRDATAALRAARGGGGGRAEAYERQVPAVAETPARRSRTP